MSASRIQFTLLAGDADHQGVRQPSAHGLVPWGIMLAALRSEPVRESEEIFLVDRVQHLDGRSLDDLVFQCGHRQGALPAIRLRNVPSPGRQCPVCSPVGSRVQILEILLEV